MIVFTNYKLLQTQSHPKWKILKGDLTGRRPQWKTTELEENPNARQPQFLEFTQIWNVKQELRMLKFILDYFNCKSSDLILEPIYTEFEQK